MGLWCSRPKIEEEPDQLTRLSPLNPLDTEALQGTPDNPLRIPSLKDVVIDALCTELEKLASPALASSASPRASAKSKAKRKEGEKQRAQHILALRQARLWGNALSAKDNGSCEVGLLPDELVEALLMRLVRRGSLGPHNLHMFAQCRLSRLDLSKYPGVQDQWIYTLMQGTSASSLSLKGGLPDGMPLSRLRARSASSSSIGLNGPQRRFRRSLSTASTASYTSASSGSLPRSTSVSSEADQSPTLSAAAAPYGSAFTSPMLSAASPMGTPAYPAPDDAMPSLCLRRDSLSSPSVWGEPCFPAVELCRSPLTSVDLSGCEEVSDLGLRALRCCLNLQVLRLRDCSRVTDAGLVPLLGEVISLRVLDLTHCSHVSDASLQMVGLQADLESLSLEGCYRITSSGLAYCSQLSRLQVVNLNCCRNVAVESLSFLANNPRLKSLSLALVPMTAESLWTALVRGFSEWTVGGHKPRQISDVLPELRFLDVGGLRGNDAQFRALQRFDSVTELNMSNSRSRTLDFVSPSLKVLRANFCRVAAPQLCAGLAQATQLEVLELESCHVNDAVLECIGRLTELRELVIPDTAISSDGLAHIQNLRLTKLDVNCCNLHNRALAALKDMVTLRDLNVGCHDISDNGLRFLSSLEQLEKLALFSCPVSDHGVQHLGALPRLRYLEICGGHLTNSALITLGSMTTLTSVNLANNRDINDRGLSSLMPLKYLRHLNLSRTAVTPKGLPLLRALPSLTSLSLFGCEKLRGCSLQSLRLPSHITVATDASREENLLSDEPYHPVDGEVEAVPEPRAATAVHVDSLGHSRHPSDMGNSSYGVSPMSAPATPALQAFRALALPELRIDEPDVPISVPL